MMNRHSSIVPTMVACSAGIAALGLIFGCQVDDEVAPEPPRRHGEMSQCPPRARDQRMLWVELGTEGLSLRANDGMRIVKARWRGDYPFDELRGLLRDQRAATAGHRQLFVSPEPGVLITASARVVEIARAEGFTETTVCRVSGEVPLMEGIDPRGGGGVAESGIGLGRVPERRGRVQLARPAQIEVRGRLSRDAVRRGVQYHPNEVRYCYDLGLMEAPDLEGRIVVSFVISPSGAVQDAAVGDSTLANASVEQCIVQAVRRWSFPASEDGQVVGVNYPFELTKLR